MAPWRVRRRFRPAGTDFETPVRSGFVLDVSFDP